MWMRQPPGRHNLPFVVDHAHGQSQVYGSRFQHPQTYGVYGSRYEHPEQYTQQETHLGVHLGEWM